MTVGRLRPRRSPAGRRALLRSDGAESTAGRRALARHRRRRGRAGCSTAAADRRSTSAADRAGWSPRSRPRSVSALGVDVAARRSRPAGAAGVPPCCGRPVRAAARRGRAGSTCCSPTATSASAATRCGCCGGPPARPRRAGACSSRPIRTEPDAGAGTPAARAAQTGTAVAVGTAERRPAAVAAGRARRATCTARRFAELVRADRPVLTDRDRCARPLRDRPRPTAQSTDQDRPGRARDRRPTLRCRAGAARCADRG